MVNQAYFFVVFLDTADNHFFNDVFRFAFVTSLFGENCFFVFEFSGRNLFTGQVARVSSCNVHCNIFAQFSVTSGHGNQYADFAAAMDVSSNHTFSCFVTSEATEGDVFADFSDAFGDQSSNGFAFFDFGSVQSVHISRVGFCYVSSNTSYQFLEVFGFSNEVGFAVNFYDNANFGIFGNIGYNETFCSDTASFFSSSSQAFFTQEVNSFVHIAFGSSQSFFAVHHTCASTFAQFFN